ncbi:hypothetical protein BT67DRAFT_421706 [Trichocladium antarcticum]|uniref:Uncharacterized protein n=1 Tax=Trichocladium antarcticum TaxID=1450529 RepID=A0AAN6UK08_9PEZI|nr:hypothetical protein BT67DRAFT_421706 [Trichocladium antarcticum]
MDFAPYQSSPPEHARDSLSPSPRASLDTAAKNPRRGSYSPSTGHRYQHRQSQFSPPPLQHPQPQRAWHGEGVSVVGRYQPPGPGQQQTSPAGQQQQQTAAGGNANGWGGRIGGAVGARGRGVGDYFSALGAREGMVSEFDTSLGLRLDYEACLAYLAVPPVGAILLLILERKSDYVRFHAWQSSLLFTALFVVHLLFSWSAFLSWVFFLGDLVLIGWLVLNAYRDADTLDRYEVPLVGQIASRILDDE